MGVGGVGLGRVRPCGCGWGGVGESKTMWVGWVWGE